MLIHNHHALPGSEGETPLQELLESRCSRCFWRWICLVACEPMNMIFAAIDDELQKAGL